jgi:hypothetical protein
MSMATAHAVAGMVPVYVVPVRDIEVEEEDGSVPLQYPVESTVHSS